MEEPPRPAGPEGNCGGDIDPAAAFFNFYLFIFGCAKCCMDFSVVAASRGSSLVEVHGFLIAGASLVAEHGL